VGDLGQKEAKKATCLDFVVQLNFVLSRVELHFLIFHGMFAFFTFSLPSSAFWISAHLAWIFLPSFPFWSAFIPLREEICVLCTILDGRIG
jgi:hypothetical protein